jgi:hypothetical protein
MAIREIWVPKAIIVVFLALPLFRSFFKRRSKPERFQPGAALSDGLTWLPFIALGIAIGIFPAYGFRPECLPMLVFILFVNAVNMYSIITGVISPTGTTSLNRKSLYTVLMLVLLAAAAIPMFAFSPKMDLSLKNQTQPALITIKTQKIESHDKEYFLRIYGTDAAMNNAAHTATHNTTNHRLIFIVPPEMGSAASINHVCMKLAEKGFTVVTYFRKNYDTPLIDENGRYYPASPAILLKYWRVYRKAADRSSVNETGKTLETERRIDIEFLLPRLSVLLEGMDIVPPLLLAGYGAGGSALAYLAGEEHFKSRYRNVTGIVAIESGLWSSYQDKLRQAPEIPADWGALRRYQAAFINHLHRLQPGRVERTGRLPGGGIPVLYLVSGRALEDGKGQKPYQAVFDALRIAPGPAAIAAIESAGPLDYQDFPVTHPLYSFLLPGLKGAPQNGNPVGDTASIIGNFASYLLEQAGQKHNIPPRQTIGGNLYIESKGLPSFRL